MNKRKKKKKNERTNERRRYVICLVHSSKFEREQVLQKQMTMELDDCMTKDCSTIYRFQFASIAFICGVYLPFTFHSSIWTLYTQPFASINCTTIKNPLLSASINNITARSLALTSKEHSNRSACCACNEILNGSVVDKRLLPLCQEWMRNKNQLHARKATIIEEVGLRCVHGIVLNRDFINLISGV